MNIHEVADCDYTKPTRLFSFSIRICGTSNSRIAPFYDDKVLVDFLDVDVAVDNVRNVSIDTMGETASAITLECDVALYRPTYKDAFKDIIDAGFVNIDGYGGLLNLVDPYIQILYDDEPDDCEVSLCRKIINTEQLAC